MSKNPKDKDKAPSPPPTRTTTTTRWTTIVRKGDGKQKETKQKPKK